MNHLTIAKAAAEKAGDAVQKLFGHVVDVRKKARADFVSEADYQSEQIIIDTIHKAFPSHRILSEELFPDTTSLDDTWIIDGVDGTNNYVSGVPIYGVNIAYYHEGKPAVAVVIIPTFKEMYWASEGEEGAFLNNARIYVSKQETLEHSAGAITTAALQNDDIRDRLTDLFRHSGRIRCTGAACYDGILVAKGVFDFRISIPEKAVDVAAPYYIVQKAGGRATNMDGSPMTLIDNSKWIVSNGKLHERLVALLNEK